MTRRLILMRHAKSSWADPMQRDHDRPLNGRGRRSATALGQWLREAALTPDEILCSTSKRTRETCEILGLERPPKLLPELYHASAQELINSIRGATGNCVLLLAHNPGIGECAERLVSARPTHPRFFDYPTGATLVADFRIPEWIDLRPGTGHAAHFVVPRVLLGES